MSTTTTYLGGPLDGLRGIGAARSHYRDHRGVTVPARAARTFDAAGWRYAGRPAPLYWRLIRPGATTVYLWAPYYLILLAPCTTRKDPA